MINEKLLISYLKKQKREYMIKKTICVDFDGVLNEYDGYEEGDLGEPLTGSKEFIKELRKKYKIVILTSRQKEQVIDWLNNTRQIVSVYDLPDSIAEEIIDYSLKLIEEGEMK